MILREAGCAGHPAAAGEQEGVAHDFRLLFQPVAAEGLAGLQGVAVAAEGMAGERQADALLMMSP